MNCLYLSYARWQKELHQKEMKIVVKMEVLVTR